MSDYQREEPIPHLDLCSHILQTRAGGRVERCHTIPHHGSYSNAAHSWGVAMLLWHIWPEHFPGLVSYALAHDVPEAWAGDIPAPVLRHVPGVREMVTTLEVQLSASLDLPSEHDLSTSELEMLKACDRLEFWLWCREQASMGNLHAAEAQTEVETYLRDNPPPGRAQGVYEQLRRMPTTARQAGVVKEMMS